MNRSRAEAAGGFSRLGHAYLRQRYAVLFYSLLFTLIAVPLVKAMGFPGHLAHLFLVANLLAAALPVDNPKGRRILLAILTAAVVVRIGSLQAGHSTLSTVSLAIWTVVALYAVFGALRFVLRATSIDREHIYAALSAYLLAGLFLGALYWDLERAWPGSFVLSGESASDDFTLVSGIYFSFVTLATVGYGDVVPGNDVVRSLAVVEAIAGQFYLVVMVARLMSLYVREKRGGQQS